MSRLPTYQQAPESATHSEKECRRWALVLVCVLAFAVKLALSLTTRGTNDMLTWEANLRKIQADGALELYRDGAASSWQGKTYPVERFNHPPFMIHLLRTWGAASAASGVPLRVWLRVSSAVADIGMLLLVCGILLAEKLPVRPPILFLLALSPVSVLVSGFHGNTDPIVVFFLLFSIYLIDTDRPTWLAGAALGMALNIKVMPVIFLPAILLYLNSMRQRLGFALSAGAVFLVASMPYLAQDPALVMRSVFGYSPVSGSWGLPQIAYLLSEESLTLYRTIGKPVALSVVLLASLWIHIRARKASLFVRCGFLAFLFLFVSSGFGVQYLSWILPWWAALPWRSVRVHYLATAAYVCVFYAVWSHGGWYLANLQEHSPMPAGMVPLFLSETACWISVGIVVLAYRKEIRQGAVSLESPVGA